jgi:cyclopropane-fatty-acyl-phospholipid synthase
MFDETFVRAWRLYLAGSEVGFTTGYLQLFQLTFARAAADTAWTRAELYR